MLLVEAEWTAGELARAVNSLGTSQAMTLRYDRTAVAHWLSGSKPRSAVAELVAAAFTRRIGRLVTVEETGLAHVSPQDDIRFVDRFSEGPLLKRLVVLARADADPAQRAYLVQSAYRLAAVPPGWGQSGVLIQPPLEDRRQAGAEDVQALNAMVNVFADQTERHGGGHARAALAAFVANDVSRTLTAAAAPDLRRELVTSTAQLTHLLALMTADAGHQGLAQIYYQITLELARVAENRAAYAIALRAMSVQAMHVGHPRTALELADAALEIPDLYADEATMAFLLSQQAVVRARDGQRREALTKLSAAEKHLERSTSTPGPFTAYPRAALEYQRAHCLLALGQRAAALAALRDSLRLRIPERRRTSTLTEARMAEVLLAHGHLDEACAHWDRFLDQCSLLRSTQVNQAVTRLQGLLRPYLRQRQARLVWDRARSIADGLQGRY